MPQHALKPRATPPPPLLLPPAAAKQCAFAVPAGNRRQRNYEGRGHGIWEQGMPEVSWPALGAPGLIGLQLHRLRQSGGGWSEAG